MTEGEAEHLRQLFIRRACSRLKFTLRDHPELAARIDACVQDLAHKARFDLVESRHTPRDASKSLKKFVEIIVARFRRERVATQAEFDSVWRTVPVSAKEFCRKWFKKFDPNVYC